MAVFAGQVTTTSDDAAEQTTGAACNLADTGINMNTAGAAGDRAWGGFRFLNVTIPRGVTVTAADIQLYHSGGAKAVTIDVTIQAQAADNPGTFTTAAGDIDTRTRTTASVTWTATWSSTTQFNVSPDIAAVIQEVLNRALWVSGNALVIVLNARSTNPASFNANDAGTTSAKLDITYTLAAPPQPRPRRVFQAVNRSGTY